MPTGEAFADNLRCKCDVCGAGRAFECVGLGSAQARSWRDLLSLLVWLLRDSGAGVEGGEMLWCEVSEARGGRAGRGIGGGDGGGRGTERMCRCCRRCAGGGGVPCAEGAERRLKREARKKIGGERGASRGEDGFGRHRERVGGGVGEGEGEGDGQERRGGGGETGQL